MAPDQSGEDTWRVRYRRGDGTVVAVLGFPGKIRRAPHNVFSENLSIRDSGRSFHVDSLALWG